MSQIDLQGMRRVEFDGRIHEFPVDATDDEIRAALSAASMPQAKGPLGLVSPEFRETRRESVEGRMTPIERFIARAGPPTLGTIIGGAIGGLVPPPLTPLGIAAGAAAGGGLGELTAQEVGVSPTSKAGLAASTVAPLAGPMIGGAYRMGGQATRWGIRQIAPAKAAVAQRELGNVAKQAETMGTSILASQRGLAKLPQSRIRETVTKSGQAMDQNELKRTFDALNSVAGEIRARGLDQLPHGQSVLRMMEGVQGGLMQRPASPILRAAQPGYISPVSFDKYLSLRSEVGQAIKALENQAGVRLGSAKRLFSAMAQDLDDVVKVAKGPKLRAAHMSKRFLERSKLEFAVDDLNEVMAGAIRSIKGEGADIAINAKTVLDRLSALTNPRHSQYDKNFAEAMKDHLPQIKRVFEKANELAVHGPGGPGSLVIRGKFAAVGGGIGGALGSTFMGTTVGLPLGMGAGAAMGAKMPEYIVAGMLHPRGRRFLEFAIREGRGTISPERWATFTQIVNQQLVATGREGAMQAERLLGQREPVPQLRTRDDDELRDRAGFMERYGIR